VQKANMSHLDRITINPTQCGGRPCIRVKDIPDLLAAEVSGETILDDHPYLLESEDIAAALEFAARQTGRPVLKAA
jgi:uncharacterized protein (DUF433 family)